MIQTNVKSYLNFKVTLKKNTRRSQPVTHYRIPPPESCWDRHVCYKIDIFDKTVVTQNVRSECADLLKDAD